MRRKVPRSYWLKCRAIPAPTRPSADKPLLSAQFFRNLIAMVVASVLISWWLRALTDSFETVVSWLGLGGVLTWAAYVWKAAGEQRQKAICEWVTELFAGSWPERVALLTFGLFLIVSCCCGAIRVENLQGGDAIVQIYQGEKPKKDDDGERLASGVHRNFPQFMWPWQTATIRVKVSGLPAREVSVYPWWRAGGPERLSTPSSFLRPVVLIGATYDTVNNADSTTETLTVVVNGKPYLRPYTGRAVLVGAADADLPIPVGLQGLEGWKELLNRSSIAAKLMPPQGGVGPPILRPGDTVSARITKTENNKEKVLAESWPVTVSQPADRSGIIVPVLLTLP